MKAMNIILLAGLVITLANCNNSGDSDEPQVEPVAETLQVDNTTALTDYNKVIYEMNLYNFTSQGTFKAAEARLQELRTLGVDIVWLMPIQTRSTQGKIGNLGSPYALKNYTEVNPDHGTLDDFKAFVTKAHSLGMQVWLDWVPNHTGLDNIWVTEHKDYYEQSGGNIVHPNNYSDVYQLNYSNDNLQQAMIEAMKYWIANADIDGFRCDYVSSPKIPYTFWQKAIPELRSAANNKYLWMLGEADFAADAKSLLSVGFDFDYAWGYHDLMKNGLGTGENASSIITQSKNLINNNNYTMMDRMVYLTNHDDIGNNFSANYFNYWGANVPAMTVLEFTMYGMPLLYNGQEIGYHKVQNYFNRDAINWNAPNNQIKNTIRTLVALRHTQPALAGGKKADRPEVKFLDVNQSSVVAYEKRKGNNVVVVVLNFASTDTPTYIIGAEEGEYEMWLDSKTIEQGPTKTTTTLKASEYITIPAKGYMVYVKK